MNADGSSQIKLTNNSAHDEHPSWSPDGSKIAFTSKRDGNYEVYVMNADGSGQTRLTTNPNTGFAGNIGNYRPSWSPDGSKITFESARHVINEDGNHEIYVMDADGSNQIRLTNIPAAIHPADNWPDW